MAKMNGTTRVAGIAIGHLITIATIIGAASMMFGELRADVRANAEDIATLQEDIKTLLDR